VPKFVFRTLVSIAVLMLIPDPVAATTHSPAEALST